MICCILGGADITDYSCTDIPDGAFVIAADRGYMHCKRLGIEPDVLLGDFDSIESDIPDDIRIIRAPCEKDDTDLIMAVKEGMEHGCDEFVIYGAEGGRMGHTFANIQTLSMIAHRGYKAVMTGNVSDMRVQLAGRAEYENKSYKYISLFSLSDESVLEVSGLKYGSRFTLSREYPMGVSNEFTEDKCVISVISGEILIIFEK